MLDMGQNIDSPCHRLQLYAMASVKIVGSHAGLRACRSRYGKMRPARLMPIIRPSCKAAVQKPRDIRVLGF